MAADRQVDVLLPTHEQSWLFAAAGPRLTGVPTVVADIASFDRVQSKVEFARLLDQLALPQPERRLINSEPDLAEPLPRDHIAKLGEVLAWHGGRTLDYLHRDGVPQYIECNPRTVEPGDATACGVNLQQLQIRLAIGQELPSQPAVGTAGVRTHGTMALILGASGYQNSRQAVIAEIMRAVVRRDCYR